MNAMLLTHLRTAEFVADAASRIATCTDGTPNHLLRGTFTLRGINRPLDSRLPVSKSSSPEVFPAGQGVLELDRPACPLPRAS